MIKLLTDYFGSMIFAIWVIAMFLILAIGEVVAFFI